MCDWVKDRSLTVGGSQNIRTLDGFVIPINIISGFPCMWMAPNTQKEHNELPHVIFTNSAEWEPRCLIVLSLVTHTGVALPRTTQKKIALANLHSMLKETIITSTPTLAKVQEVSKWLGCCSYTQFVNRCGWWLVCWVRRQKPTCVGSTLQSPMGDPSIFVKLPPCVRTQSSVHLIWTWHVWTRQKTWLYRRCS